MTVSELIAKLSKMPPEAKIYRDAGDFKDDWREVRTASHGQVWGINGVFLE